MEGENDGRAKRRSQYYEEDEEPRKNIESAIYNLGNRVERQSVSEEIQSVLNLIKTNLSKFKDTILDSIIACILDLPQRTHLHCNLIGLLNQEEPEVIELLLNKLQVQISNLTQKNWWHLIQVFRISIELANSHVIPTDLVNEFLSKSGREISNSHSGEALSTSIILALPFMSEHVREGLPNLPQLLVALESFSNSTERFSVKKAPVDLSIKSLVDRRDGVSIIFAACKQAFDKNFDFKYKQTTNIGFNFESKNLHQWIPLLSREDLKSIEMPRFVFFQLFKDICNYEDDFSRVYCEFMIHMLVEAFEINHRRAAEVLLVSLPDDFGSPEKLICHVLFSKLLFTNERSNVAYYEILLINCCRLSRAFPPALARSLLKITDSMDQDKIDLVIVERLATWFAHHLSHYDFKWNWEEWRGIALEKGKLSIRHIFLRILLFRLLVLSYHEKIESILPDYMVSLLISSDSAPVQTNFVTPQTEQFTELSAKMKQRIPSDELLQFIGDRGISLAVVFEAILALGSKTFSHLLNAFERYLPMIHSIIKASFDQYDAQKSLINVTASYWTKNIQNFHIVLEKLVHYRALNVEVLFDWMFSEAGRILESIKADESDGVEGFEKLILIKILPTNLITRLVSKAPGPEEQVIRARMILDHLGKFSDKTVSDPMLQSMVDWFIQSHCRALAVEFFELDSNRPMKLACLLDAENSGSALNPKIQPIVHSLIETLSI